MLKKFVKVFEFFKSMLQVEKQYTFFFVFINVPVFKFVNYLSCYFLKISLCNTIIANVVAQNLVRLLFVKNQFKS